MDQWKKWLDSLGREARKNRYAMARYEEWTVAIDVSYVSGRAS